MAAVLPSSSTAFDRMLIHLSNISKLLGKCRLMSMHLGSSIDSQKLRRDILTIRQRMEKTIRESRELFVSQCREHEGRSDHDQDQFERVYAMYVSAVEYFLGQLVHMATILRDFPKCLELIVTGVTDVVQFSRSSGFSLNRQLLLRASKQASGCNTGSATPFSSDEETIEAEIKEMNEILIELHSSVHLRYWDIVPDMPEGTSHMGSRSSLLSSEEDDTEGGQGKKRDKSNKTKKRASSHRKKGNGESGRGKSKAVDSSTSGPVVFKPVKPLFFAAASDGWYLMHRHDGFLAFFRRFLHRRRFVVLAVCLVVIVLVIIISLSVTLTRLQHGSGKYSGNETSEA